MAAVFSVPIYPGAVSYDCQYSDPTPGNPNEPNRFGTWTPLVTGITSASNIPDPNGNESTRLYRVRPNLLISNTAVSLQWYDAFFAQTKLFDPQITSMLPSFRDFLSDYGNTAIASTDQNLDSGAGVGLLLPDGDQTTFSLAESPDTTAPTVLEYSVKVVKNNLTLALNTDYWVDYEGGTVTFAAAPLASDTLIITYKEVRYTNRMLNSALQLAIDGLAGVRINGFSTADDNNVKIVNGSVTTSNGLQPIVFAIALKMIMGALVRKKADEARLYKSGDFSFDNAPSRLFDGLSAQSVAYTAEIRAMANNYIRTATYPVVRSEYDSWFDFSGKLPIFAPTAWALTMSGYASWI